MKIELYPLEKIVIDGTPVFLGMKRFDVEKAIGKGQNFGDRYYYYDDETAIDYNENNTIEFIEFLGGIEGSLRPVIYGISAFDTLADDLITCLKQKNNGEVDDSEQGYSYSFLNISVGVYREMKNAKHWETIGIGVSGYYINLEE